MHTSRRHHRCALPLCLLQRDAFNSFGRFHVCVFLLRIGMLPLLTCPDFRSVSIFRELQFALSALPETFLAIIKGFVSLRRIEKVSSSEDPSMYARCQLTPPYQYLALEEIELVTTNTSQKIIAKSVTLTWPRTGNGPQSTEPSAPSTPKNSFVLELPSIECPEGGLTLVCGRLG